MLKKVKFPVTSIRRRIYWSFSILVLLFVITAVATIVTINDSKRLSNRLSGVVEPSLQSLKDFERMMLESKMYTTNWVFLRSKQEDKELLKELHNTGYTALKEKMRSFSTHWVNRNWVDSLNKMFDGFEKLLAVEKNIMASLKDFRSYDDPVIRLEAERQVEDEVLPRTAFLMAALDNIEGFGSGIRMKENEVLEKTSARLRFFIIVLSITIVCAGVFLSRYMTRIIIKPITEISLLVSDLGRGIIGKSDFHANSKEISEMISSVNNLSEKLHAAATFAHETGLRNFDMPFTPLSEDDTLGKALLAMRENLQAGEINLELNNKELERKNKELEQFAFVASHDLQEPLRTASSFVGLLQQQYKGKLDDRADKYLSYVSQASNRMQVLVTDLLEYSRIGAEKELMQVDCNAVLKEVLADLHTAIQETDATITADHLPVICGYPTEIKQLFQNLVFNAIKFRKKDTRPQINITACTHPDSWHFAFSDNGIGIAEKNYDRIFIIFQRLHIRDKYQGSGIGLSHCKKIVELHKGKIWLESELDHGTTFYFTIQKSLC